MHSLPVDYQKFLISTPDKIEQALNSAILYESMKPKDSSTTFKKSFVKGNDSFKNKQQDKTDKPTTSSQYQGQPKKEDSGTGCYFCKKPGHFARDFFKKKKFLENKNSEADKNVQAIGGKYFVTLHLDDCLEELLVDTGAAVSVLPASRYSASDHSSCMLTLADGRQMKSDGCLTFRVTTPDGHFLCDQKFFVADVNKPYLGTELLESANGVIHTRDGVLCWMTCHYPCKVVWLADRHLRFLL